MMFRQPASFKVQVPLLGETLGASQLLNLHYINKLSGPTSFWTTSEYSFRLYPFEVTNVTWTDFLGLTSSVKGATFYFLALPRIIRAFDS